MVLQYPSYSLGIKATKLATEQSTTKTISGINLPDMSTSAAREQVAGDLDVLARLFNGVAGNTYVGASLTTKEEVTTNG